MPATSHLLIILVLAVFAGSATAARAQQDAAERPDEASSRISTAVPPELARALEQREDWNFDETPLNELAEALARRLNIPALVDRRALEDVGLDESTPVSIALRGVTTRSLLNHALRQLDLTWTIDQGVLKITTPETAEQELLTCVYRVDHLLQDQLVGIDDLMNLIVSNIEPGSWEDLGGPGTIEALRKSLVVSQTTVVHDRMAVLLKGLESLQARQEQSPDKVTEAQIWLDQDDANQRIHRVLRESVSVTVGGLPLSIAASRMTEELGINVVVDHKALQDVGLDEPELPTGPDGLPLSNLLTLLLAELDLIWQVRDGALVITTPESAEEQLITYIYPVYDFIGDAEEGYAVRAILTDLASTVASTVEPESWEELGGPGAMEIFLAPAAVVISQTDDVHAKIRDLLTALRKAGVHAAPGDMDWEANHLQVYMLELSPNMTAESLMKVLTKVVAPESWDDDAVILEVLGDRLVIRQSAAVHAEIAQFLTNLHVYRQYGSFGGGTFR